MCALLTCKPALLNLQQPRTNGIRAEQEERLGVEGLCLDGVNGKLEHLHRVPSPARS